ncbi:MAG TPA: hypothetical protein VMV44_09665, partial [Rectinemataceae bacterium]|nr:hypothetical protein [Rectinemataceae bacterium]
MNMNPRSAKRRHTAIHAAGPEAEIETLKKRLAELEAERRSSEERELDARSRIRLAEARATRLHDTYLKRLNDQTKSTQALSETVNSIIAAVKEISLSYREMLESVQSVGTTCRELADSFQDQARTQEEITRRTEAIDDASAEEVREAQALKTDLGQLESIRAFMSTTMDTIADVSDRLSLLSMNGRIEAAHAGAAGR